MARQYVAVEFHPSDRRSYTYHFDDEPPLHVGERVIVDTPKEGAKVVTVVTLQSTAPPFPTKPVKGRAP